MGLQKIEGGKIEHTEQDLAKKFRTTKMVTFISKDFADI